MNPIRTPGVDSLTRWQDRGSADNPWLAQSKYIDEEVNSDRFYRAHQNSRVAFSLADTIDRSGDNYSMAGSYRVAGYFGLFSNGKKENIPTEIYDAALLSRVYSDTRGRDSLLADMVNAEMVWAMDNLEQEGSAEHLMALLHDTYVVKSRVDEHLGVADSNMDSEWSWTHPETDLQLLAQLKDRVHQESIVINAADILEKIKFPSENDMENKLNIKRAEEFYVVALSVLGFQAFAAELASSCHIARMRSQGKDFLVDQATEIYRSLDDVRVDDLVNQALQLNGSHEIKWIVNEVDNDVDRGVNCCFGEISYVSECGRKIKVKIRKKTIGSIAKKLESKGRAIDSGDCSIMDLIGLRVIVGDGNPGDEGHQIDLVARYYASICDSLDKMTNIDLKESSKGKGARYVQGTKDFVDYVASKFKDSPRNYVSVCYPDGKNPEPYSVAKMTADANGFSSEKVPFEIQFNTGCSYYLDEEQGAKFHGFYKANGGVDDDAVRSLIAVTGGREYFGSYPGKGLSLMAGRKILSDLRTGVLS